MGVPSNVAKMRSSGRPNAFSIMATATADSKGGTRSCRRASSSATSGGNRSRRVDMTCPNLTKIGPSLSSAWRRRSPRGAFKFRPTETTRVSKRTQGRSKLDKTSSSRPNRSTVQMIKTPLKSRFIQRPSGEEWPPRLIPQPPRSALACPHCPPRGLIFLRAACRKIARPSLLLQSVDYPPRGLFHLGAARRCVLAKRPNPGIRERVGGTAVPGPKIVSDRSAAVFPHRPSHGPGHPRSGGINLPPHPSADFRPARPVPPPVAHRPQSSPEGPCRPERPARCSAGNRWPQRARDPVSPKAQHDLPDPPESPANPSQRHPIEHGRPGLFDAQAGLAPPSPASGHGSETRRAAAALHPPPRRGLENGWPETQEKEIGRC